MFNVNWILRLNISLVGPFILSNIIIPIVEQKQKGYNHNHFTALLSDQTIDYPRSPFRHF